ncbi:MAG: YybH family protein [Candidatus Polarisedimenticolia bacterium]
MTDRNTVPTARPRRRAVVAFAAGAMLLALLEPARGAAAGAPAAPKKPGPADASAIERAVAEIRAFEERFNAAYGANDLKAYWDCFDPGMTQYWQEGRLDLAEYRVFWEKELASGARMVEVKTAGMVIHVAPSLDAAVAAYAIFTRMRRADGSISESWNQETDVLFKRDGRWRVAHMHYSDAPPAKTGA